MRRPGGPAVPKGRRRGGVRRLLPARRSGWIWVVLTIGAVLNGLRLRRQLSGLSRLAAGEGGAEDEAAAREFVVAVAPGVSVDDATIRAAAAHASRQGLEVLDLVPGDLPGHQVLDLARILDTTTYRSDPLAVGRGALHATMVRRSVWERTEAAGDGPPVVPDRVALLQLTNELKQFAPLATDLVVAPSLAAVELASDERREVIRAQFSFAYLAVVTLSAGRSLLLLAGLAINPGWGAAALASAVLQPYLVTAGGPLGTSRHTIRGTIGSWVDPLRWIGQALAGPGSASPAGGSSDPVDERRPLYRQLLAGGLDPFFEARRQDCPACGSHNLAERIRMPDLVQGKPGLFVLDRCSSCGHVFQNPRLSPAGLDFYYRDIYDGLGSSTAEFLFSLNKDSYRGRVDLVRRHCLPQSWLDVGTGYAHFCLVAGTMLPSTRFDGLDMGQGVLRAQRRRWIDHAYQGSFPALADQLAGRYDVVSMHHYLEHTIDPWAELDAAQRVLRPGGFFLIEVPDPESRFADLLGRAWPAWIQPQHLHFLPCANLAAALGQRGFRVVEVERGPARQPIDVSGGLFTMANAASPARAPWRDPPTVADRARRVAAMGSATLVAPVAIVADLALQPIIRTRAEQWSNTYRILARREDSSDGAAP